MFDRVSERQFRRVRNQHMRRSRLVKVQPKRTLGLKKGTWLTIILFIMVTLVLGVPGFYYKQAENTFAEMRKSVELNKVYAAPKYHVPSLADAPEREQNISLIKKIWGTNSSIGLAIARCESGYRTKAVNENTNGTEDQGVFQVNTVHNMPDMFNPISNISYAYTIYLQQGTTPWDSSSSCWDN